MHWMIYKQIHLKKEMNVEETKHIDAISNWTDSSSRVGFAHEKTCQLEALKDSSKSTKHD